jgi:hypothetical protein
MTPMTPRRGAPLAALAALFVLTACGGGGGGSPPPPPPPPPPAPTASLTVTADSANASPDGAPVPLHAVVTASSAVPAWTLEGPGSLSASTGSAVSYLPPTSEAVADGGTATVTIAATGLTSQTVKIALAAAAAVPGRHWTTLRESGVRWQGVASDGALYVAFGDRGRIATSPDGQTWTRHDTGETDTLSAAVHADHGWIAVGHDHALLHSDDGLAWTSLPSQAAGLKTGIVDLVVGNGHYVGAGPYGSSVSEDGTHWNLTERGIISAAFGNGVFVGIEYTHSGLVYSVDGMHWLDGDGSYASAFIAFPHGVAFANGRFVAISGYGAITSTDGIHWSAPPAGSNMRDVYATQDAFFTVCASPLGGDDLCDSGNGGVWDHHSPINTIDPFAGLAGDAHTWVRASNYGSLEWNPRTTDQWSTALPGTIGNLTAIDYVAGRTVAVSSIGWAISSADGKSWDSVYTSPFSGTPGEAFGPLALAHRGNVLVAVGTRTNGSAVAGEMTASTDGGQTWSIAADQASPVRAVIDDGQRFVAVGDGGQVYASTDGHAWNALATVAGAPSLVAVAHGGGVYVATGPKGTLATSPNGASWSSITPTTDDAAIDFSGLLFDGKQFVRIGTAIVLPGWRGPSDGIVQTSADGVSWTTQSHPVSVAAALAFHDGEYVLLGGDGALYSSRDLKTWTRRVETTLASFLSPDGPDLRNVAFVNGQFAAVGANELILASSR